MQAQSLQGMMWVTPWSKSVTAIEKIGFKHSLENARGRPLQQSVSDSGHGSFELHIGPVSLWDRPRSPTPFIHFEIISLLC
jgi:hypothetical protein